MIASICLYKIIGNTSLTELTEVYFSPDHLQFVEADDNIAEQVAVATEVVYVAGKIVA